MEIRPAIPSSPTQAEDVFSGFSAHSPGTHTLQTGAPGATPPHRAGSLSKDNLPFHCPQPHRLGSSSNVPEANPVVEAALDKQG